MMKHISIAALVLILSSVFVACSSDDDSGPTPVDQGRLVIGGIATYNPISTSRGLDANILEIASFKVNFEEIEIEFDDDSPEIIDDDSYYNSLDDIELEGPFEVELISSEPITIVDIPVPNGVIDEIEFEFYKNEDSSSDLYNKSMQMEGTINGQPFVFWHDFEEEIELEFEDGNQNLIIHNNEAQVVINFDLTEVFNASEYVDMGQAVDGNGDGLIEISPEDDDGNNELAQALKQAIKAQIELIENLYDD